MRFIARVIVVAFALWLTTLIVNPITVKPFQDSTWGTLATYSLMGLIFTLVNTIIGGLIKIVAFPLYVLTLGLLSILINGVLLWIVYLISQSWFRFGLNIPDFWIGVLGALVLGVLTWLISLVIVPARKR